MDPTYLFLPRWAVKLVIWLYINETDGEFLLCVFFFIDLWLIDWSPLILMGFPALWEWRRISDSQTWAPFALNTKPSINHPRQDSLKEWNFGKCAYYSSQQTDPPHRRWISCRLRSELPAGISVTSLLALLHPDPATHVFSSTFRTQVVWNKLSN